ncbi:hypothetical protein [Streptomyces shenzhenensis]|uniref:hypothetical protein n=1 Tax=Streptomyces shenzhenensis TaxID=943815 RepID=UPI0015F05DA0|nr:hypothetical protein [Streptomyces shenzhenensis]
MTTPILARGEGRALLAVESVLSTVSAVWWLSLLWIHRNVLYAVPMAATLIAAVILSLLLTWGLWLRSRRLAGVNLTLVAVRGVAVLTLSLWLLHEL